MSNFSNNKDDSYQNGLAMGLCMGLVFGVFGLALGLLYDKGFFKKR
jgi:hypothetical protein